MEWKNIVPIRAYLLHLTHYSPGWCLRKRRERPIDMPLALEIVDAIAAAGFNTLIIDCEDGLEYKSHPELERPYSIPRAFLTRILRRARARKLELIPKLNFSHSMYHRHDYWFRPYSFILDMDDYWKAAFELMEELIGLVRPKHFFHIGMDEDDSRSHAAYINAVRAFRKWLDARGLRPIIWNDTAFGRTRPWHTRKSLAAEKALPKDVVQVVWDYKRVRPAIIKRVAEEGFDVWAAPGQKPSQVLKWKKALLKYGGRGLVMTTWLPCRSRNRPLMLEMIQILGPIYSSRV
ncbi:MAG: hypothetical protein HY589_05125 [Candidatus Omnitrophica bacterium]|nr:hypothetical protein [Candidatus Omnitrophota bacterium]